MYICSNTGVCVQISEHKVTMKFRRPDGCKGIKTDS